MKQPPFDIMALLMFFVLPVVLAFLTWTYFMADAWYDYRLAMLRIEIDLHRARLDVIEQAATDPDNATDSRAITVPDTAIEDR